MTSRDNPTILTNTSELDFDLPEELIAQEPAKIRGESQLLVVDLEKEDKYRLGRFSAQILEEIREDDLLVVNDSKVLNARIKIIRKTGGRGEVLLLKPMANAGEWTAMVRPAGRIKEGEVVYLESNSGESITMVRRLSAQEWLVRLDTADSENIPVWLEEFGEPPLPPYIHSYIGDSERYQTIYSKYFGSVAAPTAGLHFTSELLEEIGRRAEIAKVTLHVGLGTFKPIDSELIESHNMHSEQYSISQENNEKIQSALSQGRRVVAVGSTSTRVLESVYSQGMPLEGDTNIFITPGYKWGAVDAMITNFHLPKSTLIAMVMSFLGVEEVREAYKFAVKNRMKFFSFGDAMFIHRK